MGFQLLLILNIQYTDCDIIVNIHLLIHYQGVMKGIYTSNTSDFQWIFFVLLTKKVYFIYHYVRVHKGIIS